MTVGAVNSAKTVTMSKYKKVKKLVYITVEKYYDDLGKVKYGAHYSDAKYYDFKCLSL